MKKIISVVFALLLLQEIICAQVSVDPNHAFYQNVQSWQIREIVTDVPPLRPYPLKNIKNLLEQVIANGTQNDVELAKEYWEEIFGKKWNFSVSAAGVLKTDSTAKEKQTDTFLRLQPSFQGDFNIINDNFSVGYILGVSGVTAKEQDFLPIYTNLLSDGIQDPSKVGIFDVYLDMNTSVAAGFEKLYFQTGVNRLGFGPFIGDNVALNEGAYHSANIGFTILQDNWTYTQNLAGIGATYSYDGSNTHLLPDKYISFHQLEFKFARNFSMTYYEAAVFGQRFDPSYFIPSPYMVVQGIGGCKDNTQLGLLFTYRPVKGLLLSADCFVDDIYVNEIIKLNFDTKIRVAGKAGVIYFPEIPVLKRVSLDYTAVTPYTYSHWDYKDATIESIDSTTYNYQNYTNNGIQIGSSLPPNSDCIALNFKLEPVKKLNLDLQMKFLRHGNSTETLPVGEAILYLLADENVYATDGSVNHHVMYYGGGTKSSYMKSAYKKLNFLNQEHKMYVVQCGLSAYYEMPSFSFGKLFLNCSYTFEYIKNKGIDKNVLPGGQVSANEDGTYSFTGESEKFTAEEMVSYYKTQWTSGFRDTVRNFLRLGLRFEF